MPIPSLGIHLNPSPQDVDAFNGLGTEMDAILDSAFDRDIQQLEMNPLL